MAGRGPAPKASDRRARRGQDQTPTTILKFEEAAQPELPDAMPWPDVTRQWWAMWADSPQAELFGSTDWSFLLDTAWLHAMLWGNGDLSVMAELRIRVAKFGATPEDRARLRIQFAEADEADTKRPVDPNARSVRQRAQVVKLTSIDGGKTE